MPPFWPLLRRNSRVKYWHECRLASISIKTSALRARFTVQSGATTVGWFARAKYLWPVPPKLAIELFVASAGATGITQELGMRNDPEIFTASAS